MTQTYKKRPYVDHMGGSRAFIFILALIFTALPCFAPAIADQSFGTTLEKQAIEVYACAAIFLVFGFLLWAAWIALVLVKIVQEANWKSYQSS